MLKFLPASDPERSKVVLSWVGSSKATARGCGPSATSRAWAEINLRNWSLIGLQPELSRRPHGLQFFRWQSRSCLIWSRGKDRIE